ncbi:ScbA/BarX family gamma-butyrolactone biosynthesis protein [Amycolatopsis australiensis]|uniref:A-factor biosynthesis hotdog domain-containing protein n=1 Tax=Amycolatopsis australiensis TaxID=546364 RepID=A0A1K1RFY2_9PSEU|nr:ScbA/BarX family gamma-butyrolactone biosynthesis protein [Amycolatopsis australiensis]SFW70691.1 A-factor biosynthesis hotdog domain-containing protein [Amycolatopsis australiensis]
MTELAERTGVRPAVADPATAISRLGFDRTVARGEVHREALSEVFLTDSVRVDASRFVAAARLPASHAYYGDHTGGTPIDPLLLLECCRQAETHAVHAHFGAPRGTKFVLQSWSLSLHPLPAGVHIGPAEVVMSARTDEAVWRDGELRALRYRMQVYVAGRHAADVVMRVQYVPDELYRLMRGRNRDGRLPSSADFRADPPDVAPGLVGRTRPENVVLTGPRVGADRVAARLRIDGGHPSLFDHAQDHVPGMVLMEAGRQLAVLTAHTVHGIPADAVEVTGLAASFGAYAELDAPITVSADGAAVGSDLLVSFEQEGRVLVEAGFTCLPRNRTTDEGEK